MLVQETIKKGVKYDWKSIYLFFCFDIGFFFEHFFPDTFEEPINIPDIETIMINEREYYLISTETQLRMIDYYGLDRSYMQQNDIEISDVEWIPIGTSDNPFTGSYNGNGFKDCWVDR